MALREAEQEAAELDLGEEHEHFLAQAQDQIVEGAKMRFDLGLSQSVRRAGLVAFVSTMEWCALLLKKRMKAPCPKKPEKVNEAVHVLGYLSGLVGGQFAVSVPRSQVDAGRHKQMAHQTAGGNCESAAERNSTAMLGRSSCAASRLAMSV